MKSSKINPDGFNLYKNGKFWTVITEGDNEQQAIKDIKDYVGINQNVPECNSKLSEFTYKQFKNHSTDGFELKSVKE